jgi:Uma2 family endonuclease
MEKPATVEDLYSVEGKAELVHGRIRRLPFFGRVQGHAVQEIKMALREHVRASRLPGIILGSTVCFVVDLPHRQTFCPDVAYYVGPDSGMKFPVGAPRFVAESRDPLDENPDAERDRAEKRRDYFAAGTVVVWDVDLTGPDAINVYRRTDPETPAVYRRGEVAEAEPAVPRWTMPVDVMFEVKR